MFERKPRYLYPNIGIAKQLSKIEDLTFWIRGDVIDGHQKHIANVRKTLRDSHVVKNGLATVDRTQKSMGHWYIYCSLTSLGKRSCAAFRQGLVWNQNEKRVDIERTLRWYANSLCYCDHGINQNIFNSINLVIHPKLISNSKKNEFLAGFLQQVSTTHCAHCPSNVSPIIYSIITSLSAKFQEMRHLLDELYGWPTNL